MAGQAGIGRATLYRYFSDVEAILSAWHEQQIEAHLRRLRELHEGVGSAAQRLAAVLETYAHLSGSSHGGHDSGLVVVMHRADHVSRAAQRVRDLLRDLVPKALRRGDVPPDELAGYCLHALAAVGDGPAQSGAVARLINVILAGYGPPPEEPATGAGACPRMRARGLQGTEVICARSGPISGWWLRPKIE